MMKSSIKFIVSFIIVIFSFIYILQSGAVAVADEPGDTAAGLINGFKGVKWGATKEEFLAIRPDVNFEGNKEDFFGQVLEITYHFSDEGKWDKMYFETSTPDSYKKIKAELKKCFGRSSTQGHCGAVWEEGDITICMGKEDVDWKYVSGLPVWIIYTR